LVKLNKELEKEQKKEKIKFYNNDSFTLAALIWCIFFMVIQFTIIVLAGPEADFISLNNIEIITMIILAFLILLCSPFLLKIANEKIATTFLNFDIKPDIQEKREEAKKRLKKYRFISYSVYSILFAFVLTMTHYSAFKETELAFELELRNILSDVLLTTDFNLSWGIVLYVLYILLFILFYTYVLVLGDIFFTRLAIMVIPSILTNLKEFDTFNGDNSMGFSDIGNIGKIIIFSSSTIIILCIPKLVLSYSSTYSSLSVLDTFVNFVFIFSLMWMFYLYQALLPLHKKMKESKNKIMSNIIKEIDMESKKLISSKSTNQRKTVKTKDLELHLELRKQLINVNVWPISSRVITVFISQSIVIVIAIMSWIISVIDLF